MIRVFAQLGAEDTETFRSIIISPFATTRDVIDQMVLKYFKKWDPQVLELVEVSPKSG